MAVLLHDVVGLQHASMAIYNAWCDRVPMLLLGGTGPVSTADRRPWIDWIHTALVQGQVVRGLREVGRPAGRPRLQSPSRWRRAHAASVAAPPGPVYVCFDVGLQEAEADITDRRVLHGRLLPGARRPGAVRSGHRLARRAMPTSGDARARHGLRRRVARGLPPPAGGRGPAAGTDDRRGGRAARSPPPRTCTLPASRTRSCPEPTSSSPSTWRTSRAHSAPPCTEDAGRHPEEARRCRRGDISPPATTVCAPGRRTTSVWCPWIAC